MMYELEFSCEETGEHDEIGPFDTLDEAVAARYEDYPGYGSEKVKEITDEKAAELIVWHISELTRCILEEEGRDPDDKSMFDELFRKSIREYCDQKRPGYNLIPEYMKKCNEEELV